MTRKKTAPDWPELTLETWNMLTGAAEVIALRSWRILIGGPAVARREFELMFREKVDAGFDLARVVSGASSGPQVTAQDALEVYRGRVDANLRRLT